MYNMTSLLKMYAHTCDYVYTETGRHRQDEGFSLNIKARHSGLCLPSAQEAEAGRFRRVIILRPAWDIVRLCLKPNKQTKKV